MEQEVSGSNQSEPGMGQKGLGPIASLNRVVPLLRENTFIFGVAFIYSLIKVNLPLLSIVSTPFLAGGLYSVLIRLHGEENLQPENWLSVFIEGAKKKYVRLLVGYLVFIVLLLFLILSVLIISLIGQTIIYGIMHIALGLGPDIPLAFGALSLNLIVAIITITLMSVLILGFEMFIQFYDIGIVSLDYSVENSFKESVNFVKKRFNSVLGFTLIRLAVSIILTIIPSSIFILNNPTSVFDNPQLFELSTPIIILLTLTTTLYTAFSFTYKTTFYIYNVVEDREKESARLILLKLFGIVLFIFILFSGSLLLFSEYL